ncbi:MAG: DUF1580 domain-containing protein [Planctomycetaceae bacterium]|nr:DUF1580 domain-containing protein [Planctomycetaceae bacterium]
MAIDPLREDLISLHAAAKIYPRSTSGRPTHVCTVYRHTASGCHGIILESIQCGGRRCTSREAVARFFQRLTIAAGKKNRQPNEISAAEDVHADVEEALKAAGF